MFKFASPRRASRFGQAAHVVVLAAVAALSAGCASEAGSPNTQIASNGENVEVAQGTGSIVQATPVNTLSGAAVRQRFLSQPRPAEIVVNDYSDLDEALVYSQRATSGEPSRLRGARWIEAAQVGLLFGSPEGKAFLTAPAGRALVRGEPAETCPALNVATAATDDQATDGALRSCLREMSARSNCGCRVIARADRLLAPKDEFQYAIGVASSVIDPATQQELHLTAEERMIEGRPGSRRLWLLGAGGPFGMLQVEPDGRAALVMSGTGKRYDGSHQADGFRRGRVARRAYLTSKGGKRMVVLIGFEDSEVKDNRDALAAWNPYGPLELKKAEAE